MGKKKPQKTKELSVAIAEASSRGDDQTQQQTQSPTPRKRGRPRKIIEKIEIKEGQPSEILEQAKDQDFVESQSKKVKFSAEEEEEEEVQVHEEKVKEEGSSAFVGEAKESGLSTELPRRRGGKRGEASTALFAGWCRYLVYLYPAFVSATALYNYQDPLPTPGSWRVAHALVAILMVAA